MGAASVLLYRHGVEKCVGHDELFRYLNFDSGSVKPGGLLGHNDKLGARTAARYLRRDYMRKTARDNRHVLMCSVKLGGSHV